jgi:hypothetical protein
MVEWDLYIDVLYDYWREVYDLVHEYNMTDHYSKSWTSFSTWIYAVRATCLDDSTSCK